MPVLTREQMKAKLKKAFGKIYGGSTHNVFLSSAPGRVNIIGEHTDYNHGYVFPCGLDKHMYIMFRPRSDTKVNVVAIDIDEQATVDLANIVKDKVPQFMKFIVGPADWLKRYNGGKALNGFDAVLSSTIPNGGGVSSSSAMCVCSAFAFRVVNASNLAASGMTQDQFFMSICEGEWLWSGVRGGIMDQYASVYSRAGRAFVLDCRTGRTHPEYDHIMVPENLTMLIANTNIKHSLAHSPYNKRRASCERAAAVIAKKYPSKKITHLRDCTMEMLEACKGDMDKLAYQRALHVIPEDVRTVKCGDALKAGDLKTAGEFVNQSHNSLRDLYEVSCKELDIMVDIARSCDGCYGARMMGGGFGGCAIVLVAPEAADRVTATLQREYTKQAGREPSILATKPGDGARVEVIFPISAL